MALPIKIPGIGISYQKCANFFKENILYKRVNFDLTPVYVCIYDLGLTLTSSYFLKDKTFVVPRMISSNAYIFFENITRPFYGLIQRVIYTGVEILGITGYRAFSEEKVHVCISGPIAEELLFRGVIQHSMLRKLPKMVLKKVKPEWEGVVDHPIMRVARVCLSSFIFMAGHLQIANYPVNVQIDQSGYSLQNREDIVISSKIAGTVSWMIGGLAYGILVERSNSLISSAILHMGYNTTVSFSKK